METPQKLLGLHDLNDVCPEPGSKLEYVDRRLGQAKGVRRVLKRHLPIKVAGTCRLSDDPATRTIHLHGGYIPGHPEVRFALRRILPLEVLDSPVVLDSS